MDKYIIGIDLGGMSAKGAVFTQKGELLYCDKMKTNKTDGFDGTVELLASLCKSLAKNANINFDDVEAIGVGAPGVVDSNAGVVLRWSNFDWQDAPLAKRLSGLTGKQVFVANDANTAALGEAKFGATAQYQSSVLLTIGTGVGGGIVLDGHIWDGFNGAGAEIGHIVIVPGGRLCSCGNRGCFEAYCSATALINDTKEAMINNPDSLLWKICGRTDNVDGKSAYVAAEQGDTAAKIVIDRFIKYFSIGIANIVTLLQPEVVGIGGGMSAQGETLIAPIDRLVSQSGVIKSLEKRPKIVAAGLLNDAGIVGAAADIKGEM